MTLDLTVGGYATEADYANWVAPADPPAVVVPLLRSATFVIAWACARNPYNDTPSDTDAPPLRDATCAQVQAWIAQGVTPEDAGLAAASVVRKSSILGADVEMDTSGRLTALQEAAAKLAPVPESILLATNLLWQAVPMSASVADRLPQWGQGRTWGPFENSLSGEYEWPAGLTWF